jgi:hypothetical protein
MIYFHPVLTTVEIDHKHPLHVSKFFDLTRMWWSKRKERQAMVLSIAVAWYNTTQRYRKAPGFIEEEVLLTSLTSKVKDAKHILTKFFIIKRTGYNFNDGNKSPTIVSPRKLPQKMVDAIEGIIKDVCFYPGIEPLSTKLTKSKVKVRKHRWYYIHERLISESREDLMPAVKWLCEQNDPIYFYFQPSGKLQARDTSVWPIKSIETWPGWLRRELFGSVVDIENAYCQFLVNHLYKKYTDNENRLKLKYPDILRADQDKQNFREELCRDVLRLPVTVENISIVKRLIMALANGSNATPALMVNGSGRSEAVRIVLQANPNLKPSDLLEIGKRLSFIAKQFRAAKKDICMFVLGLKPTARNLKKVFELYFEWERDARYKMWEMTGFTGLALHDGLDGILIDDSEAFVREVLVKHGLKVHVENCENDPTLLISTNHSHDKVETLELVTV